MHLCRFSTGLDLKAWGILIICLISIAYVAALPVTVSTEELMSRSELVPRTDWRAQVQFRRKLPPGLGKSSQEFAGIPGKVETAITNAIQQGYGSSIPVTFSTPGEIPEWVNNRMGFDVTWSTGNYISPSKTAGHIQKEEDRNNIRLNVELERLATGWRSKGSAKVPVMSEDEFPILDSNGRFAVKKVS
ncbi:hypothetical protein DFH05DRAFT_1456209 [Lentinula detonsa]|uniref:Uncharacterized protein n=1 Tax=Lentinula detonsa TaxID=2804962 RepID=A0A9W8U3Z9_9AGAR|nr:hypothetical protein DFH05DRAFT_1456209 [Lentinula detonsa]KAJ3980582.1 hypothetical protein F5890DRAFT_1557556 [Lentinula detonsa]